MMQLLRSVGVGLGIVFALVVLVAVGIFGVGILVHVATEKCSYYDIDRLPSPSGRLAVARTQHSCISDEEVPPIMFSLLPMGAPFDEKKTFLSSSDYNGLRDWLSDPLAVFAKWLDDNNLLVAAPEGAQLERAPSEFDGIHIQYGVYPLDAEKTRNDNLKKVIEKKVVFAPTFSTDQGIGTPGSGCHLSADALDGVYLDKLALYLTARTTFAVKANDAKRTVLRKAYSTYDFQIAARDETERPDKHATGAEIIGFSPREGKSRLWVYDLNRPGIRAPNGQPGPKWDFGYIPNNPHDIIAIAEELKSGGLSIRVGYWLDDTVVIYAMAHPVDGQTIDKFERCIADNHIFDTPLHEQIQKQLHD